MEPRTIHPPHVLRRLAAAIAAALVADASARARKCASGASAWLASLALGVLPCSAASEPAPSAPEAAAQDGATNAAERDRRALALAFPEADRFVEVSAQPSEAERSALTARVGAARVPSVFAWREARRGDQLAGYAILDDTPGRSQPITYLLAVEPDLRVRSIEILAYRETHGGEVRRASWRQQFVAATPASKLRLNEDVRNIAGATISCRSLVDAVRGKLACLDVLVRSRPSGSATGQVRIAPAPVPAPMPEPAPEPAPRPALPARGVVARTQYLMGTTLRVQVVASDAERGDAAIGAVFARVAELEAEMSSFRADSAVRALDRAAGGELQTVTPDLHAVLAAAEGIARASGGAFDVTAAPLVELWRDAAARGALPDDEQILRARACVGWQDVELASEPLRARLRRPGMRFDLGGIGKGFALDRARTVLEAHGIRSALLDFGGQMLALEAPPGEPGWSIELRDPSHPGARLATIELAGASISTSADDERGLEIAGQKLSHIVDPRTGRPAAAVRGASVIARSATEADALSTAVFVLGSERGMALALARGASACVVGLDGGVTADPGFERLEVHEQGRR